MTAGGGFSAGTLIWSACVPQYQPQFGHKPNYIFWKPEKFCPPAKKNPSSACIVFLPNSFSFKISIKFILMTPLEQHHQIQRKLPPKRDTLTKALFNPPCTAATEMVVLCSSISLIYFLLPMSFHLNFNPAPKKKYNSRRFLLSEQGIFWGCWFISLAAILQKHCRNHCKNLRTRCFDILCIPGTLITF